MPCCAYSRGWRPHPAVSACSSSPSAPCTPQLPLLGRPTEAPRAGSPAVSAPRPSPRSRCTT
eukprot:95901-Alexandrium_andersonii.AAC.1